MEITKKLMKDIENAGWTMKEDKTDYTMINDEPWHYRYVGAENALFMKENDMCLEEYIEYLKQYE